jgi:hypothetical protein
MLLLKLYKDKLKTVISQFNPELFLKTLELLTKINNFAKNRNMKKILFTLILTCLTLTVYAQSDSLTFKGYLYNEKYDVYMIINFYKNDITVPHQEIYGKLSGFFGDIHDGRKWLFTSAKITSPNTAELTIINDYGSEDLTAKLKKNTDNTYTLKQIKGSVIKIARNRKWVKMPDELIFIRKAEPDYHTLY